MKIVARTDTGLQRTNNQDYYTSCELQGGAVLAVVCDGMGGANGGNIASESAAKTVADKLNGGYHKAMNDNSIKHLILTSIEAANATVFSKSKFESVSEQAKKQIELRICL